MCSRIGGVNVCYLGNIPTPSASIPDISSITSCFKTRLLHSVHKDSPSWEHAFPPPTQTTHTIQGQFKANLLQKGSWPLQPPTLPLPAPLSGGALTVLPCLARCFTVGLLSCTNLSSWERTDSGLTLPFTVPRTVFRVSLPAYSLTHVTPGNFSLVRWMERVAWKHIHHHM